MRKEVFRMSREDAVDLLRRSRVVHLATTDDLGAPVLRTVHGVVVDGAVAFHGAPAGEKMAALGRPAVVAAEELVAEIPSYFLDPELACPATTYYRSVQVHGRLEPVEDIDVKARVLQALMEKYQPEGGHAPITADDPRYRKQVAGILIVRVAPSQLDGKAKLGQNRRPDELARVLEQLWRRGGPGDLAAIEAVRAANPAVPTPAFLQAPAGARLCCTLGPRDLDAAVDLLAPTYWNLEHPRERLARAQLASPAWVGAHDGAGRLVATARAVGDGAKWSELRDVAVDPAWRGRGLGLAVVRLLLDHPAVRRAHAVHLRTRDAQPFYRRLGFAAAPPPRHEEMALRRP
jgi:nitroimidazol reductase NimA-like FMN-containing flavoprotein (pyridoxamine 5'-phosphate oxidase superfamily)/GNAT superfamily N-acetyltransferase